MQLSNQPEYLVLEADTTRMDHAFSQLQLLTEVPVYKNLLYYSERQHHLNAYSFSNE
jgi:hypothetical protein